MFADLIKTQMCIDPDTPQWVVEAYHSTLKKYIVRMLAMFHETDFMKKVRGGPLLTEIINNMEAVASNKESGKNILIYSGHDITLLSVAYALGVESQIPDQPNYGDTFMVDLLDSGDVEVVYMNTEDENNPTMSVMDVPGCGTSIPLDAFRRAMSHLIVEEGEDLCAPV